MDFQNRPGSKTGGGGVASGSESSKDRKERLRKLALETIDLARVGVHYLEPGVSLDFLLPLCRTPTS